MQKLIPFILIAILLITPLGNSALAQSDDRPPCTEDNVISYALLAATDMDFFSRQMIAVGNSQLNTTQVMQLYIDMMDKHNSYIDMEPTLPECVLSLHHNLMAASSRYAMTVAIFAFALTNPSQMNTYVAQVERISEEALDFADAISQEANSFITDNSFDDIPAEIPSPAEADPNDPHTSLLGLIYTNQTPVEDGFMIYSYTTEDAAYHVTVAVMDSERSKHDYTSGNYTLDYTNTTLSNVNVEYAYAMAVVDLPAYRSLAFDFQYGGKFYSGEITNANADASKDILPGILANLIAAIQIATQ